MALNILIVDDSDIIRSMISKTLRLAQLPLGNVYEASNGREALELLSDEWVDLVLADINMPVMTGAEMIDRMRELPETVDVPVIVVSTEGATERIDELMRRGIAAWVRKPFTPEEIRDVILQVTAGWHPALEQAADIDHVFSHVLETFAFSFPEPAEALEVGGEFDEELVCATISFSGAVSGTLSVAAPAPLCSELAANILGLEPQDPDAMLKGPDTLGEIANIAAGHLATRIDPHGHTHLHPPVVARMEQLEWSRTRDSGDARAYMVEEHPVLVTVGLRQVKAG
jgi:two-component system, chemotaxis family, chemotaxis protein CheY